MTFCSFLMFLVCVYPLNSYALKVEPHPIQDLIEGDERTPPEGEHIVEERAATPAYPLPNMARFPQERAIETFPKVGLEGKPSTAVSEFEDEWAEWSSWEDWSDVDEWESWEENKSAEMEEAPPSSQPAETTTINPSNNVASKGRKDTSISSAHEDEWNWDSWISDTGEGQE